MAHKRAALAPDTLLILWKLGAPLVKPLSEKEIFCQKTKQPLAVAVARGASAPGICARTPNRLCAKGPAKLRLWKPSQVAAYMHSGAAVAPSAIT